jgi:hypothetical protein
MATMQLALNSQIEILEEALAIEHARRMKAERVLLTIAEMSKNEAVKRLAFEYLEGE